MESAREVKGRLTQSGQFMSILKGLKCQRVLEEELLGSLRATLVPAVAVPVRIIGSFAVPLLSGYSANTISLLALVLAISILVDDAIVVVDNVERVIE